MASTYTANSGIEKPGSGEQSGTWGTTTNTNFDIIDRVLNGVGTIPLSGTSHALSTTDGSLSDGHYKVLILTNSGTLSGTNTVTISPNDQDKLYLVNNTTSESVIFTQGSGGNITVLAGSATWIYADGAGAGAQVYQLPSDLIGDTSPQLGGNLDTNSHNILIDNAHFIADENENEQIIFQTTSSAVNQIDVTNAATGNAPQLSATGDDTNVNLKFAGKGTGTVEVASNLQLNGTTNNWTIEVDSDDHLLFKYNGTAVFALQDTGTVIAADDITAFGTPT